LIGVSPLAVGVLGDTSARPAAVLMSQTPSSQLGITPDYQKIRK
jgi:hypothetical protein